MHTINRNTCWQGVLPPQYIFANRRFRTVALDPPNFHPGSWVGAGNCFFHQPRKEFILTARLRKKKAQARGFAAIICRSSNGETFEKVYTLTKEWIAEKSGLEIHSLEGVQLLEDPLTGNYHLYVSVNTDQEFAWGGIYWQTYLLRSSALEGPWEPVGLVLRNDQSYDNHHARDISIAIVDGRWYCLYKARDADHRVSPALATSIDGITWSKHGPLTVDGEDRSCWMSGTFFAASSGLLFIGLEKLEKTESTETSSHEPYPDDEVYADAFRVGHGGGPPRTFIAYQLDYRNTNLETIFRSPWEARSDYEHPHHPVLGYASLVFDPFKERMLIYVEAIDPHFTEKMGINETVERVLVYEVSA